MDIILYNIIIGLSTFLVGYFFGSIPTGVILCKLIYHKDPREDGSKNSGGTNVGRLFGKKMGLAVIALDMIKTAIPLVAVWLIFAFYERFQWHILNILVLVNVYLDVAKIRHELGK